MKVSSHTTESLCKWITEFADFGIIITDSELRIISINKWIEDHLERNITHIKGCNMLDCFPEIRERKLERYLYDALRGASTILSSRFHNYLLRLKSKYSKDQSMKQTVKISALSSEEGPSVYGLVIHIEDVTDRFNREELLQKKNEELQKLNSTKDKFFRIISHDLRSPFTALLGFSELLTSEKSLTDEQKKEIANTIHSSIKSQYTFLENLLKWSQLQSGNFELVYAEAVLSKIINHILKIVGPVIQSKDIEIIKTGITEDLSLFTDSQALTSILYNLVFNALKFTDTGGRIEISVKESDDNSTLTD